MATPKSSVQVADDVTDTELASFLDVMYDIDTGIGFLAKTFLSDVTLRLASIGAAAAFSADETPLIRIARSVLREQLLKVQQLRRSLRLVPLYDYVIRTDPPLTSPLGCASQEEAELFDAAWKRLGHEGDASINDLDHGVVTFSHESRAQAAAMALGIALGLPTTGRCALYVVEPDHEFPLRARHRLVAAWRAHSDGVERVEADPFEKPRLRVVKD